MIAGLEGTSESAGTFSDLNTTRSEPASSRGKRAGRPTDTDVKEDRRIATAWKTRQYESYEELAAALGKSKSEVKRALDRHRHRVGKTASRKSSQPKDKP
jgi:hypothetical protein